MSKRLVDRIPFPKILIILVSIFGIALGLCGVNAFFVFGANYREIFSTLGMIELIVMIVSAIGIVLTVIAWVIVGVGSGFTHKDDGPQKLFDEDERQ